LSRDILHQNAVTYDAVELGKESVIVQEPVYIIADIPIIY
jgi:hypothetical protein